MADTDHHAERAAGGDTRQSAASGPPPAAAGARDSPSGSSGSAGPPGSSGSSDSSGVSEGARGGPAAVRHTRVWLLVAAMVAAAFNLRPAVTSLGPLLDQVRHSLGMSGTVAGLLTSVPSVCFALFGVLAPVLARRVGPAVTVLLGMVAVTAGLAARPTASNTPFFLLLSAVALAGIAVSNVLMPVLVKRFFPDRIGPMTGVYSMALSAGTAIAAAATVPLTGALGGDWRPGLAVWAIPAAVAVLAWLPRLRDGGREGGGREDARGTAGECGRVDSAGSAADPVAAAGAASAGDPVSTADLAATRKGDTRAGGIRSAETRVSGPRAGGPRAGRARIGVARSRTAWFLAVFFGLQATAAYVTMGWLPQIFQDAGVSAAYSGLLLAITMAVSAPLSFVLPALAARRPEQGPFALLLAAAGLAAYAGLWLAPAAVPVLWALLAGLANAAFPLALTMIGLRARGQAGVAELSAFAQSVGYLISIPGPMLVGVFYQHTGGWTAPLAFLSVLLVPQAVAGWLAGRPRYVEDEAAVAD